MYFACPFEAGIAVCSFLALYEATTSSDLPPIGSLNLVAKQIFDFFFLRDIFGKDNIPCQRFRNMVYQLLSFFCLVCVCSLSNAGQW